MKKKYNFENLVLLVGTNPLPNYVVGKYFLINNPDLKKIWLVYSEKQNNFGTKEIAERIKDVLNKDFSNFGFCPLENISVARDIKKNVETNILEKLTNSLHLNYTGGTKAMAVHVYRAIEKYEQIGIKSFSYLDARIFVLTDDEKGIITEDLRKSIDISFDNLIKLHGYEKYKEEENYLFWKDALHEFEHIIQARKLKKYLDWKTKIIRKIYYSNGDFEKKVKKATENISKGLDDFNNDPFKQDVICILNKIPPEHSILDLNCNLWIPETNINNDSYNSRIRHAIDFLDGKWLENYVYEILKDGLSKNISISLNWKLKKEKNGKDFELDIVTINGYQICGISITTSQKEDLCKSKGFEVFHRVNQIGGDEAKAILITCLTHNSDKGDQITKMEDDLRVETNSNILVLGLEDLVKEKLLLKITEFIGLKGAICQ